VNRKTQFLLVAIACVIALVWGYINVAEDLREARKEEQAKATLFVLMALQNEMETVLQEKPLDREEARRVLTEADRVIEMAQEAHEDGEMARENWGPTVKVMLKNARRTREKLEQRLNPADAPAENPNGEPPDG
jgi:hypothetical protein